MIKYRVELLFTPKIEKREVERETEKSVFWTTKSGFKERSLKNTTYYRWFDTWEEGHKLILHLAQERVNSLRLQLDTAKGTLGNIKGMKPYNA